LVAVFGGYYYWWPKIFGRPMSESLGKVQFWLLVIGFNLTFFPMHFLGLEGMPRRTYTYADGLQWDALNLAATIGAFVIALSVLVFVVNAVMSRRNPPAPSDPWDARTIEWMTSSPPPEYNFAQVPIIEHRDELWHRKYTEDDEGRLLRLPAGAAVDTAEHGHLESGGHGIHMPSPSYWPLVFALGLPIIAYGFVFKNWWILAAGALVGFFGLIAWGVEPATAEEGH
jgi:cytochrome c oxidase subunit 1